MRAITKISFIVVAITLLLFILNNSFHDQFATITVPLLVAGILFPGIPHGALDHKLGQREKVTFKARVTFVSSYIFVMILVGLIWIFWINLGVLLFILYSAWHFGETDTRSMKVYSPFMAMVFGLCLLVFLLSTHTEGYNLVMDQLGSIALKLSESQMSIFTWLSLPGLFLPLIYYQKIDWPIWFSTISVLFLSTQLPLLLAFLLYFVGLHSFRGWFDIHRQTGITHARMMLQALPFSLSAYLIFLLVWWIWNAGHLDLELAVPAFFAFLAAISLPHILYMHKFYGHSF